MAMATLTKGWLAVQRLSPLASWQEARQQSGTHGVGEVAEHSTCGSTGSRERQTHWA